MSGDLPPGEIDQIVAADGWYAHFESYERGVPLAAWALIRRANVIPPTDVVGLVVPMHDNEFSHVVRCDREEGFLGYSRASMGRPGE